MRKTVRRIGFILFYGPALAIFAFWFHGVAGVPLSAIGISLALIGICVNLIVAGPYVGASFCMEVETWKRKVRWANRGNAPLVLGTVIQLVSLFLKK